MKKSCSSGDMPKKQNPSRPLNRPRWVCIVSGFEVWVGPEAVCCDARSVDDVEAIQVHHFGPGSDKVGDEPLLGVGTGIDFGDGAQL